MKKYGKLVINGDELLGEMDGMRRVAKETLRRLDGMLAPGQAEIIVRDKNTLAALPRFKNIRLIERKGPSFKWKFINIDLYCMLGKALELGFRNRAGYAKGIYYLHDLIPLTYYGEKAAGKKYYRDLCRMKKNALMIVTVSEYSKSEIISRLKVDGSRVTVIKNGWEHYKDIRPDGRIFEKYPDIKKGQYYFSLGSISPHKNFGLIYELAKRNKAYDFVVAGRMNRGLPVDVSDAENLIFTGGLSDGEVKALMMNAKAFIFPSYIEGMGLPVLEALSCGTDVCVSDIPVMHEHFGSSVRYFDPDDAEVDLKSLTGEKVDPPEAALDRLSWDKAAAELYALIQKYLK